MPADKANIYDNIPNNLPDELIQTLCRGGGTRIERIISRGHESPEDFWYDQENDEWVIILRGGAVLEFEHGRQVQMRPGDYMNIPAHTRHRVVSTDSHNDTVWLAVHYNL
ncbi:nif11 domain/cupin domain protein [Limihaloglobus sulfuriphilus]|uniref:Nif11 domain/cupin domain protein n=1 Tax=Limihaloglobus sulfuriphilus TaxID=1851148 RepID=A0A1Q2MEK4_9BACT|nr:cupin domain-containing protein [Limihaloglobus sulfuriphilus]AQQ71084.1 nif11 domain/cupin domain protein [Limihaloglobus sulfuriphilus]